MQYRRERPPKRSSDKLTVNVKYGHKRWRPKKVRRVYEDDGGSSLPDTWGEISFSDDDLNHIQLPYEEPLPLVVTLDVADSRVHRVLISIGTKSSVMYWDTFNKMQLDLEIIKPNKTPLVGIDGKIVNAIGSVYLPVSAAGRTLTVEFVLIDMRDDMASSYNLIMGREWINRMKGVASTFHLKMKCPATDGNGVVDINGDQLMAKKCVAMEREMSLKQPQPSGNCYSETGRWKKLNSEELGIDTSMISKPTNVVLNQLKEKGYEVYLVGGCVRDLILKRTPKDFNIITSAKLKQVLSVYIRVMF
ncbi:uncharacterized protein LOC116119154 [Pistacia vera]|uniref:uncharacterized protein LOC116119154 n=1 Tax=Pistacia vera TaxID=55513 RepID=UPI0012633B67|nr:uncharacterized protein LOC116119154 [Pistacia vera]